MNTTRPLMSLGMDAHASIDARYHAPVSVITARWCHAGLVAQRTALPSGETSMVSSKETTPTAYLASLPAERRKVIAAVRKVIKANLPDGYAETMNWGMLSYEVPLNRYPVTYNKQPLCYIGLAAQKNNYAIYLMNVYSEPKLLARLQAFYKGIGKKLDMGKSCLRFKELEHLPLDVIGELVAATPVEDMIRYYENAHPVKRA